ncbi:hypothetical protein INR49_001446 [Caranx melampygus]|nr:hypothetical protein INR49_001446 [Caranx melampygus]
MFNKKPRRNFRQRKASSSDEEDQQKNSGDGEETEKATVVVQKPHSKVAQGRGITCSSKKPDSSDEERGGEDEETLEVTAGKEAKRKDKDGGNEKTSTVLSFSDDKEAEEPTFKLKRSSDKAVLFHVRKKEASPAKTTHSTASAGSPSGSEASSSSSSRRDRQKQKKRVRIPKTLPPVSVSMVKKRIAGKLDSLKEVYRARQAELRRMEGDVECAKTSVESLEESSSESQLKFYRSMTLYVHNLVECLREKVVEINSLELELHSLLSDQLDTLLAQRRNKVKEQADSLQQLNYEQSGSSANGTEMQGAVGTAAKAEADCDIPEDTQPSAEEEEQLQQKMADILSRSQAVFSDVQDDFCNVKNILSRFEEWRSSYSDSYHNAYISLCLPKLLNPIIRHQLLAWNPLKDASGDFENLHGSQHWRRFVMDTVMRSLSTLTDRHSFVELVWDPMSHQQSVCLSDLCHRLREDYSIFEGEQSKPVKALVETVVRRLRSCVDEDVFIPLYPKKFLDDRLSPQSRFREQQLWTAIKLLGNMGKMDLLLPESVMMELMLDKLLNRYLMTTLCSQTSSNSVRTCKKIADSLPISWFKGEDILPQLRNMENHLVQKVHTICKQQPPDDPNTKSAVVEVLQVLSRIRCKDSIMAIAGKYHYEDVIYSHQLLNNQCD